MAHGRGLSGVFFMSAAVASTDSPVARESVFSVRGLTKVYGDGEATVRALDGVDLDLNRGELVVLLGPSGSGKSTLLNQLRGRSPTSASASSGSIGSREISVISATFSRAVRLGMRL